MLLKPGLKPVLSLLGWNRLPRLLAKLGAIFRNLIRRQTRILIRKVTPRDGASCKPSKPAASMTSMTSPVATRGKVLLGAGSLPSCDQQSIVCIETFKSWATCRLLISFFSLNLFHFHAIFILLTFLQSEYVTARCKRE